MHQGRNNYPKFQTHENEGACRSEKLSGTRKRDQSLLLLEVERRLRTEDRNDQVDRLKRSKQKIAGTRESKVAPVIASSRAYSRRKQNASAILKRRRLNRFVIITTRNATADPRYGFGTSSELMEQAATVD